MASVGALSLLTILLVLQPRIALGDFLSPLLAPLFDDVCKLAQCGKGKCVPSQNSTLSYVCECDPGWKQTRSKDDNDFKFLPCVVPNCTINGDCVPSPAPAKSNASIFDPCHWADCGGGSCNKTSAFTHTCLCPQGFFNLFSIPSFPCYPDCSIGLDCRPLGIIMQNASTTASAHPPALADTGTSQAGSNLPLDYHWLIVLVMSLAILL